LFGVPCHTSTDHFVVVVTVALLVAKIISMRSIFSGKSAGLRVYEHAAISPSAKPACTTY